MNALKLGLGTALTLMLTSSLQAHAEITAKYRFQIAITYNFAMKASGGALLLKGTTADYDVSWSAKVHHNGEEIQKLAIDDGVTMDQPLSQMAMLVEPGGKKVWTTVYKQEEGKHQYIISDDQVSWNPESGELADLELSEGEAEEFQMIPFQAITGLSNTQVQNTLNAMFGLKGLNTNWIVSFTNLPRERKLACSGIKPLATCKFVYSFDMSAKQNSEMEIPSTAIETAQKPKSARKVQEDAEREGGV